ncbi:ubiquitin carboxyl-terminal hydrolase Usp2 isoform X2 [Scaptodrosophila lebanonensis]|uniref:ubiquitinyl hydrolase 1 n=1 Tax=Drosophila lebanonensis TaxID=7225 RepID=A0A6J2TQJ3_DROLE|nr:ubiquitin carboxyl-terminal hydrolase Usp2 isoform X2 [Scaptodrosophila lebanonensis]
MMLDVKKTRGGAFHKVPAASKPQAESSANSASPAATTATTATTIASAVNSARTVAEERSQQQTQPQQSHRGVIKLPKTSGTALRPGAGKAPIATVKYSGGAPGAGSAVAAGGGAGSGSGTGTGTGNPVRLANQKFFLLPTFKDPSFLKDECELAHAQLTGASNHSHSHSHNHSHNHSHSHGRSHSTAAANQSNQPAHGKHPKILLKRSKASNGSVGGDDNKNNNNNNSNNNNTNSNSIGGSRHSKGITTSSSTASKALVATGSSSAPASGVLLNGMRRPATLNGNQTVGANHRLPNGTGTGTSSSSAAAGATAGGATAGSGSSTANTTVHRIDIKYNNAPVSGSRSKFQTSTTPLTPPKLQPKAVASSTNLADNLISGKVKSLSGSNSHSNSNNNNSAVSSVMNNNNNNNNGNNNMQQQQNQQHDDITYIDSDEMPPPNAVSSIDRSGGTAPGGGGPSRSGIAYFKPITPPMQLRSVQQGYNHERKLGRSPRPKSTIISSNNSNFAANYEKFNGSYKNANGEQRENNSGGGSAGSGGGGYNPRWYGIDSLSIKASIEKFNNLSKQKRMPPLRLTTTTQSGTAGTAAASSGGGVVTVAGRGGEAEHATTGSSSNLQQRYSSDLDTVTRMAAGYSSSLTRATYRNSGSSTTHGTSVGRLATAMVTNVPAPSMTTAVVAPISKTGRATSGLVLQNGCAAKYARNAHSYENGGAGVSTSSGGCNNTVQQECAATTSGHAMSMVTLPNTLTTASKARHGTSSARSSAMPPVSPTPSRYGNASTSIIGSTVLSSSNKHNINSGLDDAYKSARDEKSEGLCGLRNIGNTCFMNSVIQCLSHTTELTRFLRSHHGTRTGATKDQLILNEFAKLIQEMWTANVHSVTPVELKRAFSTKHRMYSDYNQQDAQEFLRFFLDSLHSALNSGVKGEMLNIDDNLSDNKKADLTWEWYARHENSLIRDLFVGQLKSTLKCTTCGNTSVTFDPFWDLSVPLPSSSRCKLDACLDLFIREEVLDGDEMPTCSKCKTRRKCTKSFTIQRFPKYLVIHLKRFSETRWSKLSNIVEFPTGDRELNMGSYGANLNSNVHYSLYAISNHMGSTAGGHYVALCKHPVSRKWHEFNDNIVSDALPENYLVSSSAYILFYERA